jgi:hypothetical protein
MQKACIPIAIQIVVDDVGWWCGTDGNKKGEPYRTGINRSHAPEDYEAIIMLGKKLNMRPQAAMILCEWDRSNMLKELPSSTWMAQNWDNSRWVGPWLDKTSKILQEEHNNIEIVLHGIGHEYWENGVMTRAEWHDRNGSMRPVKEVTSHLEFYKRLLQQNNLGAFPRSFVPAAFLHRFGTGKNGLEAILYNYGIKYISTPYNSIFKDTDTQGRFFGVSNGIITVDRGKDLVSWNVIDAEPEGEIVGPICGMHWPNILNEDPCRNLEVVERWVRLLSKYNKRPDRMLARNTEEAFSQVVYNWGATLINNENEIVVNMDRMKDIHADGLLDSFYVKIDGCAKPKSVSRELKVLDSTVDADSKQTVIKLECTQKFTGGKIELEYLC